MYDGRKILRFPFPKFHKTDLSHPSQDRNINFKVLRRGRVWFRRAGSPGMYELMLVRLKRLDDTYNCNGSGFLRAPVQGQRWDKKEKDNYYPYVCEKIQSKRTQFFFVEFKSFNKPGGIGMPQG